VRLLGTLIILVTVLFAVGCAGDDEEEPERAAVTTPDRIRVAVFERSFSECGSESLRRLARKYDVDPTRRQVAQAVAQAWTKRFGGGPDAVAAGRDGCLQAIGSS
jgi:hypothetical protein